jgi:glycerol kinase
MTRTTRRAEVVRAALDCIAYQITDVLKAMEADAGLRIDDLRVDGGPTHNGYLMQFQSDIARCLVAVSPTEELSGMGAAYAAGCGMGVYDAATLFRGVERRRYVPLRDEEWAQGRYAGWRHAVSKALSDS